VSGISPKYVRRVHFVAIVQADCHDPLVARLQHHQALAPKQHDASKAYLLLGPHGVADDGKGFLADAIGRREVIGRIEIELIDLLARHEALDVDGMIALDLHRLQLVVLEHDVLALGDLVALGLLLGLHRLAGLLVDELAAHTVASVAVERAKRDPLGGGRGREERDRTRDERELEIAFPVGTWGHGVSDTLLPMLLIQLSSRSVERPGLKRNRVNARRFRRRSSNREGYDREPYWDGILELMRHPGSSRSSTKE
jgi:hypothetical protein